MTYVLAKDLDFADIEFRYKNDDGMHRSINIVAGSCTCIFQCTAQNSQNIYIV